MSIAEARPETVAVEQFQVRGRWIRPIHVAIACMLLAFAQISIAGYRMGVGNQSIQIAFLKSAIDPTLFAKDPVLSTTKDYPTYFFRALAPLVAYVGLDITYLLLHLLTAAAVFAAAYALAGAMHPSKWGPAVALLLLVAGHHRAIAGDDLYSQGFTHTWAVFPMAIAALALLYSNRPIMALALAGIIFNFHALTGAYLLVMCGVCVLGDPEFGWMRRGAALLAFFMLAWPTMHQMLPHGQLWDSMWILHTRYRSADHVFPATWWQTGDSEIPLFAVTLALGALAMSFPGRAGAERKTLLIAAGGGLLMAAGFVFVQVFPMPVVMRAQLFRSTRLMLLLAMVQIACGLAAVIDLRKLIKPPMPSAALHNAIPPMPSAALHNVAKLARWRWYVEIVSAVVTFCCLAIPALEPWLPIALVLAVVAALINRRLAWWQAVAAGSALLICIFAARTIDFTIPGISSLGAASGIVWLCVGAALVFLILATWSGGGKSPGIPPRSYWRLVVSFVTAIAGWVLVGYMQGIVLPPLAAASYTPWMEAQLWACDHTSKTSVFLTPIRPGGFRIYSDRAVVGEWRDGTQLFFSADFGTLWWQRMTALQPGMVFDSSGLLSLDPGHSLETLDDAHLIDLANKYQANYIVLPRPAVKPGPLVSNTNDSSAAVHRLVSVYSNEQWGIYEPKLMPLPSTVPQGADPARWKAQEDYMRDVVYPNIEKYRKGDLKIQLVDTAGHPVFDAPYTLKQTRSAFNWGCSLPYFSEPPGKFTDEDFHPAVVTPMELKAFLGLFNSSMIPFSGKWEYIEPEKGHEEWADMDAYVKWCMDHDITMEMHFLSGYGNGWVYGEDGDTQGKDYLHHSMDMVNRYGNKIKYWQVTNEKLEMQYAPSVIKAIRKAAPDLQLGISDCARFWSSIKAGFARDEDMLSGLNEIRWLKAQKTPVDYFAFHGHRPFGVWSDPHEMYDAMDAFAKEGVRLHISEFGTPLDKDRPILGDIRQGAWTPELQADFYARMFTICFSHPDVDMINIWLIGPDSWQPGAGLLDEHYKPKPVYTRLDELINHTFMTNLDGKLDIDGLISARAFYGDYDLAVTTADGRVVHAKISLGTNSNGTIRLVLDSAKGTLK